VKSFYSRPVASGLAAINGDHLSSDDDCPRAIMSSSPGGILQSVLRAPEPCATSTTCPSSLLSLLRACARRKFRSPPVS